MKSTIKESIKLISISLIISFLVLFFCNLSFRRFAYVFVYFLSILVLPYWLKNNDIKGRTKLLLTILVGAISITTITYFYGLGKILYNYTIIFCVVIIFVIIINIFKNMMGISP